MGPKHNDAELYLRIAKKFAVDLPDEKDRVLALKWLKFLQASEELSEKRTKLHVTQLLLICLQRKRLVGPFIDPPDPGKKLLQYGWAFQPADIARLILKSEFEKIGKMPFYIELSGDLTEYVATQEIPQFGAHFFYAYSPEQIKAWDRLNLAMLPKGLLSVSATESPDASLLATTIENAKTEKKRARIVIPAQAKKKAPQFTDVSMIDPGTGRFREEFKKEVPQSEAVGTNLLESAIQEGVVDAEDLSLPAAVMSQIGAPLSPGREKGTPRTPEKFDTPLVETVEVKDSEQSIKLRKLKNARSKAQKEKTKRAFDDISEEGELTDKSEGSPRLDKSDKKSPEIPKKKLTKKQKAKLEKEKALAELQQQEQDLDERRAQMLAMMPARMRERLSKKFQPKRYEKFPGRDPKVKTPELFRTDTKVKYKKQYKAEEFMIKETEKFVPAEQFFADLEYDSPDRTHRKLVWINPQMPITGRHEMRAPEDIAAISAPKTPKDDQEAMWKDVELSWERTYKDMEQRRAARERHGGETPIRKAAMEKLEQLKTAQPRRIVFDEMDTAIEPEEIQFERFVFTEYSDEDKEPSILEESILATEDVFGEGQLVEPGALPPPVPVEELEKAELLLEAEMQTDDIFADDIADPSVVFKEVTVEGERLVAPGEPVTPGREGGIRIGKRMVQLPGQKPMEQKFIEQYGDVVFDDSLRAIDPPQEPEVQTPPMNDEILNRYLDQKLRKMRKGESPRVYGPWAESFRRELERIERGDESFPEEEAAKYELPPRDPDAILSESELDISDPFAPEKTAIPSPVVLADAQKLTQKYSALKDTFEVKKARRIRKALKERETEQDLLEPYIYDSLPDDRPTLLDASIADAALGQALVEAPQTPEKRDPFESFERQLDESLKYFQDLESPQSEPGRRAVYDPDFLERRVYDVPADKSIIGDEEWEEGSLFDEGEVAEPPPVHELPQPPRLSSPRKSPVPAQYVPTEMPELYRPKLEDIVPHGYVSEESLPSFERDLEMSVPESSLSDMEVSPLLGSFLDETNIAISPLLGSFLEEPVIDPVLQAALEAEEGILQPGDEALEEMPTEDIFGEDRVSTPSPVRRVSPTTLALARSIRQSVDAQKVLNRYRQKRGLPPIGLEQIPFTGVGDYIEAQSNLLDPLVQQEIREQFPGIMDEPILEEDLQAPLLEKTKKVQEDPFAEYEKQILEEFMEEQAAEAAAEVLPEEEMIYDLFEEGDIAEPAPLAELPMPAAPIQRPSLPLPSPQKPSTPFSHLYLTEAPRVAPEPRGPPPEAIDEMLEEFGEPELDFAEIQAAEEMLSPEDQELVKALFDEELEEADDMVISPLLGSFLQEPQEEDMVISPLLGSFLQEEEDMAIPPLLGSFLEEPEYFEGAEDFEAALIPEEELETDDIFGEDQILTPRQAHRSPQAIILSRSIKASKDLHGLRNKVRRMRDLPPVEVPPGDEALEELKGVEEAVANILALPAVTEEEMAAAAAAEGRGDLFKSFEEELEESQRRKEEEELAREPSLVSEGDIVDLFDEIEIGEPPAIKDIPMPPTPPPLPPAPPISFYHLERPKKYKLPLPHDVPEEALLEEEFPEGQDEEALELIPSGFEEQLEAMDEPSFEEPPIPQRVVKPIPESKFFDVTPQKDDLYYRMFASPTGWRKPPLHQMIDVTTKQSRAVQDIVSKYRTMKGLEPVEERIGLEEDRYIQLAEEAAELERLAARPPSPHTPRVPERDPFAQFEAAMERELYPSPPPPERSLIFDEDEDLFPEDMISTPIHVKAIPMPSPRPSPFLTPGAPPSPRTPASPRTPVSRRRIPIAIPTSVKKYRPELEDILPIEEILEQSFPTADRSVLEFQPSPKIEDIPPPELIADEDLPPEEPVVEDEEDEGVLEEGEMTIADVFGEDRIISPERVAISPVDFALARSLKGSEDYMTVKNKYRAAKGLPPIQEKPPTQRLREFLDRQADLLDPIKRHEVEPEGFGLLDEPVLEDQPQEPLVCPPRREDPFVEYEEELERELYASPPPPERSLLGDEDLGEFFDEGMVATPPPVKGLPMPTPKASPFLTPRTPQTPSPRPPHKSPRPSDAFSHLYLTQAPYTPAIIPPPTMESPLLLEDPHLMAETPPGAYEHVEYISVSPDLGGEAGLGPEVAPGTPISAYMPPEFTPSPQLPPLPAPRDPFQITPLRREHIRHSPFRLEFPDDIGSPDLDESSGVILFREVAPGHYTPKSEVDRRRFAERQRKILINKFGISPEAITDDILAQMSPPEYAPSPEARVGLTPSSAPQATRPPRPRRSGPATPGSAPPRVYLPTPVRPMPELQATPERRILAAPAPRRLFGPEPLPIRMSPMERLKTFLAQQPRIQVEALPRQTGLSPTDFITKVLPPQEEELELQEFPDDQQELRLSDIDLGDLAYALYIPTDEDLREAEENERRRAELYRTPPDFRPVEPRAPRPVLADASPIGETEVYPHEEGFKWLGNYVPFVQPFPQDRRSSMAPRPVRKEQQKIAVPVRKDKMAVVPKAASRRKLAPVRTSRPPSRPPTRPTSRAQSRVSEAAETSAPPKSRKKVPAKKTDGRPPIAPRMTRAMSQRISIAKQAAAAAAAAAAAPPPAKAPPPKAPTRRGPPRVASLQAKQPPKSPVQVPPKTPSRPSSKTPSRTLTKPRPPPRTVASAKRPPPVPTNRALPPVPAARRPPPPSSARPLPRVASIRRASAPIPARQEPAAKSGRQAPASARRPTSQASARRVPIQVSGQAAPQQAGKRPPSRASSSRRPSRTKLIPQETPKIPTPVKAMTPPPRVVTPVKLASPGFDPAAGPSLWQFQDMKPPIQTTSFHYRARSLSPSPVRPAVPRMASAEFDPAAGPSLWQFQDMEPPIQTTSFHYRVPTPPTSPASRGGPSPRGIPPPPQILPPQSVPAAGGTARPPRTGISRPPGTGVARPSLPGAPRRIAPIRRAPSLPGMGGRGTTADMQITKTKTPTTQTLLKKSTITRKVGVPRPRLQGTKREDSSLQQQQAPAPPELDRRTIRQRMTVGKVGRNAAVRKQSTIEIQRDEDRPGGKVVKTNVVQRRTPAEVRKSESKFAMSSRPKVRIPPPPPRRAP